MNKIQENAWKIFTNNFRIQENETVLIITDDKLSELASHFFQVLLKQKIEASMITIASHYQSGQEPPSAVSQAMKAVDIVLAITSFSLTHTKAKVEACKVGTRVGTMPGFNQEMLDSGAIEADIEEIVQLSDHVTSHLNEADQIEIHTDNGEYVLKFSVKGRKGISSTGLLDLKGQSSNIPSGESYIAPLEDSANGKILIDASIAEIGLVSEEPTVLELKDGKLVDATGSNGKKLLELLNTEEARTIAEFGIGTNKSAKLRGYVLEDEKLYGTVHIAFGSNKPFGGVTEAGIHIDCVSKHPIVYVEGKQLEI